MVDSNVLQIAKSMKRTYVELCSNYICGLDESMSLFSIVFEGSNEYYFGKINTLVKETEVDIEETIEISRVKPFIDKYRNTCMRIISSVEPIVQVEDVRSCGNFEELNSMKSAMGAKIFKFEGFNNVMYTFSSIHPINKSDKVSLKIYPYDEFTFLSEFIIDKKKYQIHEFIRYCYL